MVKAPIGDLKDEVLQKLKYFCLNITVLFIYLILKSYPKYKIVRDIADNADNNRKTSNKQTGHM